MKVKVTDDNGMVLGKHYPKSFNEFQEICYAYEEKFK